MKTVINFILLIGLLAGFSSCNNHKNDETSEESTTLSGSISIDGSSTVYPVTEAVAE